MAIQLFHGKNFTDMQDEQYCGKVLNFPSDFSHVATLDLSDDEMASVFPITQSFDKGWWKNAKVTPHFEAAGWKAYNGDLETRSTSVGDRVVLADGRMFRCAQFGWDFLGSVSR